MQRYEPQTEGSLDAWRLATGDYHQEV